MSKIELPEQEYYSISHLVKKFSQPVEYFLNLGATGRIRFSFMPEYELTLELGKWEVIDGEEELIERKIQTVSNRPLGIPRWTIRKLEKSASTNISKLHLEDWHYAGIWGRHDKNILKLEINDLIITKQDFDKFMEGVPVLENIHKKPGRPSIMDKLALEMENRARAGKLKGTITEEARDLYALALKKKLEPEPKSVKSIVTSLSKKFRELQAIK